MSAQLNDTHHSAGFAMKFNFATGGAEAIYLLSNDGVDEFSLCPFKTGHDRRRSDKLLRIQAKTQVETIYYAYVLDNNQVLLGVVSFRELFAANPSKRVRDIMKTDVIKIR